MSFDGHAELLLIPRDSESGVARLLGANDVYLANERIRQGGFPVVVVRDDTHGPDVVCLVNDLADLTHYENWHIWQLFARTLDGGGVTRTRNR